MTFYQLRRKTSQLFAGHQVGHNMPNQATVNAVNRITKLMTLYPCVYVLLTLPLSSARMWSMAHQGAQISDAFACTAGALLTSCGWVDSLLYTLTRKALLRDTMPGHGTQSSRMPVETTDSWEATELGNKGITHTRTVTVDSGQVRDKYGPDDIGRIERHIRQVSDVPRFNGRELSPTGSIDPILSGRTPNARINTHISVGMHDFTDGLERKSDDSASSNSRRYGRRR